MKKARCSSQGGYYLPQVGSEYRGVSVTPTRSSETIKSMFPSGDIFGERNHAPTPTPFRRKFSLPPPRICIGSPPSMIVNPPRSERHYRIKSPYACSNGPSSAPTLQSFSFTDLPGVKTTNRSNTASLGLPTRREMAIHTIGAHDAIIRKKRLEKLNRHLSHVTTNIPRDAPSRGATESVVVKPVSRDFVSIVSRQNALHDPNIRQNVFRPSGKIIKSESEASIMFPTLSVESRFGFSTQSEERYSVDSNNVFGVATSKRPGVC